MTIHIMTRGTYRVTRGERSEDILRDLLFEADEIRGLGDPLKVYLMHRDGSSKWRYLRLFVVGKRGLLELTDYAASVHTVETRFLLQPKQSRGAAKSLWMRLQNGGYSVSVFLSEFRERVEAAGIPVEYISL